MSHVDQFDASEMALDQFALLSTWMVANPRDISHDENDAKEAVALAEHDVIVSISKRMIDVAALQLPNGRGKRRDTSFETAVHQRVIKKLSRSQC